VRCRKDVEEGKMSILIQPKVFPLEGDSSQKVQRGKWWVKDASAVHEIPSVYITRLPNPQTLLGGEVDVLQLSFSNPKDFPVTVTLVQEGEGDEGIPIDTKEIRHAATAAPSDSATTSSAAVLKVQATLSPSFRDPFTPEIMCNSKLELWIPPSSPSSGAATPPMFTLGAFEDELLIDEDEDNATSPGTESANANSSDHAPTSGTGVSIATGIGSQGIQTRSWSAATSHNTCLLDIAVRMPNYSSYSGSSLEKIVFSLRFKMMVEEVGREQQDDETAGGKEPRDKKNTKKSFSTTVDSILAFPAVLR
jgi:hypothetical protein